MGLRTEVILWEGDKPQFETHSHKITSVDLCHNIPSLHNSSVLTPCLNLKNKSHPVKSAQARTLGVSVQKIVTVGKHSRLKSANAPPLWGDFQEPLSQKGFLKLLSFPGFLCRSKEIPKKEQSIS